MARLRTIQPATAAETTARVLGWATLAVADDTNFCAGLRVMGGVQLGDLRDRLFDMRRHARGFGGHCDLLP